MHLPKRAQRKRDKHSVRLPLQQSVRCGGALGGRRGPPPGRRHRSVLEADGARRKLRQSQARGAARLGAHAAQCHGEGARRDGGGQSHWLDSGSCPPRSSHVSAGFARIPLAGEGMLVGLAPAAPRDRCRPAWSRSTSQPFGASCWPSGGSGPHEAPPQREGPGAIGGRLLWTALAPPPKVMPVVHRDAEDGRGHQVIQQLPNRCSGTSPKLPKSCRLALNTCAGSRAPADRPVLAEWAKSARGQVGQGPNLDRHASASNFCAFVGQLVGNGRARRHRRHRRLVHGNRHDQACVSIAKDGVDSVFGNSGVSGNRGRIRRVGPACGNYR